MERVGPVKEFRPPNFQGQVQEIGIHIGQLQHVRDYTERPPLNF